MIEDFSDILEDIINRLKANGDLSEYKKNRRTSSFVNLISKLNELPKTSVPSFDTTRVKSQILDRINVPVQQKQEAGWFGVLTTGQLVRIGAGIMTSLVLVASLTLGVAVAALNSVPGDAIYPLKKVAENIELKLTPENKKANLQLKFAISRVDELQQVLQAQASGEISSVEVEKIVASAVKDLQKNTKAVAKSTEQSSTVATQLTDLSNQLKIASIQSEGQIKIDLEQAAADIDESVPEATEPSDGSVTATGKITSLTSTNIGIGTAKFILDAETKYVGVKKAELTQGQQVSIQGIVKENNKTYAQTITLISDIKPVDEDNDELDTAPQDTTNQTEDTTQNPVTPQAQ